MLFLLRLCRQRHSISNIYTLSRDSPELRCRDYCLTDVSGPAPAEPEIYRSTAGKFDKTASKKAKMTGDQFREMQKAPSDAGQSPWAVPHQSSQEQTAANRAV
jgi:hypothetical protein